MELFPRVSCGLGIRLAKVCDVVTVFDLGCAGQCSRPQVNQQTEVRGPVHVGRASWAGDKVKAERGCAGRTWDRCPLCSPGATGVVVWPQAIPAWGQLRLAEEQRGCHHSKGLREEPPSPERAAGLQ